MCQSYSRYQDTKVNKNKIITLMELPLYYTRNLKNKMWPLIAMMTSINGLPIPTLFVLSFLCPLPLNWVL